MQKTDLILQDFPASLVSRIERYGERLAETNPGVSFSRTACVTTLVVRALAEIEGAEIRGRRREADRRLGSRKPERRQRLRRWHDQALQQAEMEAASLLQIGA